MWLSKSNKQSPRATRWSSLKWKKQPPEMFYKTFLKNFAIFSGKHLCWSLFLIKLFSWEYCEIFKNTFLKNISKHLLLKWAKTKKKTQGSFVLLFIFLHSFCGSPVMSFLLQPILSAGSDVDSEYYSLNTSSPYHFRFFKGCL